MDGGSSSECDEETTPIELNPLAAKMKPLTDEVIQAIEDGDITTNNHTLVSRIKKAGDTATPLEELKFVIEALRSSNALHGQSHTMNRVIMALQMEGLLPPADAATWAKVPRPTANRRPRCETPSRGFLPGKKDSARAKVLEGIPPIPVPALIKPEVGLFCLTSPHLPRLAPCPPPLPLCS